MKAKITNKIYIEKPTEEVMAYARTLEVPNPNYINAMRVGSYKSRFIPKTLQLYEKKGDTLILPFGTLSHVWKAIKGDYTLDFSPTMPLEMKGGINLYDYQERAVEALARAKGGVLKAPCGSGKTQIGIALIAKLGLRALWLTHTHKLLEQSKERCERFYKGDFGTITEGEVNIGKDITFATVQTLAKVRKEIYENEFDVVIVDECHHCVGSPTIAKQFFTAISNCKARYKYGLSATLVRADSLLPTLYMLLGDIAHEITKEEVGAKIIKAEHRKVEVGIEYPIRDYTDTDGMVDITKLITMLSSNITRTEQVINNIIANKDRKQLALCHRVAQCEYITRRLNELGIKAVCVTGKVKESKREYGGSVIVATYALAKEGLDIPELDALHLVTPQKNESTTEQAVGRIERNIEGKQTPIAYDYVDTQIPYCANAYTKRRRVLKRKS